MHDHQRMQMEYRGYVVHFAENQEVWRCQALDVEGEKIGTVKAKIDKIIAQSRKMAEPVAMFYLDNSHAPAPVQVVALAQPKRDRRTGEVGEPDSAWCMIAGSERYFDHIAREYRYRDTTERKKRDLDRLYLDTPANREALAEIDRLKGEAKQIEEKIKATRASMASAAGHFHVEIETEES